MGNEKWLAKRVAYIKGLKAPRGGTKAVTTKPKPYFGEKDSQIEQDSLVAFGIKLYSRYVEPPHG